MTFSHKNTFLNENLAEINGLNQRGGRMLSIVDLILLKTISFELASYLITAIQNHASILIGANPGGAGKTTLMGALLGVLPEEEQIITIENQNIIREYQLEHIQHPRTYIIHEIGSGHWYGYLWGSPVIEALKLIGPATRLITNMHPDTMKEVQNSFNHFGSSDIISKFNLIIFLEYNAKLNKRFIRELWENHGNSHKLIFTQQKGFLYPKNQLFYSKNDQIIQKNQEYLEYCLSNHINTLEDVAKFFSSKNI